MGRWLTLNVGCVLAAALPTLDIAEGALDKLFGIYKQLLPSMGGYLTHAGELHRGRLEMVLRELANLEFETLEQRAQASVALCQQNSLNRYNSEQLSGEI